MSLTSIEWTDRSVNPIRARLGDHVGHHCEKVSPGCANCYASKLQSRFQMPPFQADKRADVVPFFQPKVLREVLTRRKPTKWFWCDMSDLFGAWVPDTWIDQCFAVMALTPQHTHQVLTKRPARMLVYINRLSRSIEPLEASARSLGWTLKFRGVDGCEHSTVPWPIPSVWLGASVENQATADERIPLLLQAPAAVRFISAEPLLGPVDLARYLTGHEDHGTPFSGARTVGGCVSWTPPLDWLIVGGESGPGARRCDTAWVRAIVQQCAAASVPCFVKQLGAKVTQAPEGVEPLVFQLRSRKGGDPSEWPEPLRVREFPNTGVPL